MYMNGGGSTLWPYTGWKQYHNIQPLIYCTVYDTHAHMFIIFYEDVHVHIHDIVHVLPIPHFNSTPFEGKVKVLFADSFSVCVFHKLYCQLRENEG